MILQSKDSLQHHIILYHNTILLLYYNSNNSNIYGELSCHWRREWQTTSYSCLGKPMNSMKRQKDRTLKDELPRSVGRRICY